MTDHAADSPARLERSRKRNSTGFREDLRQVREAVEGNRVAGIRPEITKSFHAHGRRGLLERLTGEERHIVVGIIRGALVRER